MLMRALQRDSCELTAPPLAVDELDADQQLALASHRDAAQHDVAATPAIYATMEEPCSTGRSNLGLLSRRRIRRGCRRHPRSQ